MAKDRNSDISLVPVRRIVVGALVVSFIVLFLVWRIDSPRVERFRAAVVDAVMPAFSWVGTPVTRLSRMVEDFESYTRLYEQNQELRRELQDMKAWREAAIQLEQENAKLLALNSVRLNPTLTKVTGVVMADSGSPFRQSVLLNVGLRDGIMDGWAVMDGLGLVGRISGVAQTTSRVILLTDPGSRIPVTVQPSGQRAILSGDNLLDPLLTFLETPELVRPGNRVVSSGDGGVFPADILIGQVVETRSQQLRVRLSAELERLDYLKVLRSSPAPALEDTGGLVVTEPLAEAEVSEDDDGQ